MKSVLISIKPKWVEKIASGEKTIEVRKTRPKLETPFKCYIYCTLDGGMKGDRLVPSGITCGKVIGEFVCDRIDSYLGKDEDNKEYWDLSVKEWEDLKKKSGLTIWQIIDYTGDSRNCNGWHISDLKIYDNPKELSEFRKQCEFAYSSYEEGTCYEDCIQGKLEDCRCFCLPITRPPQSWCYVEELGDKK